MMRGKSPPSDVEMSKTLNLNLDLWRPSWIDNGEFFTLYSIHDNDHLYQFLVILRSIFNRGDNLKEKLPFIYIFQRAVTQSKIG